MGEISKVVIGSVGRLVGPRVSVNCKDWIDAVRDALSETSLFKFHSLHAVNAQALSPPIFDDRPGFVTLSRLFSVL